MKPTILAFVLLILGMFSFTLPAHAIPTVADVEKSIADRDWTKAKGQLQEVIKEQPNSYVAHRYMLEIIAIENARDNVSSTEYKIAEATLLEVEKNNLLTKQKEEERIRNEKLASFFGYLFKILGIAVLFGLSFFGVLKYREYRRVKQIKLEEHRREEAWCGEQTADLLDISVALDNIEPNVKAIDQEMFDAMRADTNDLMNQIDQRNYRQKSYITSEIRSLKDKLRVIWKVTL